MTNRQLGITGSVINIVSVAVFAVSMLIPWNNGSYFSSMFIALGLLLMTAAFASEAKPQRNGCAYAALGCAAIYAAIILLVYFAQLTTVRLDPLGDDAMQILDYSSFGLMFSYDLLGYALMALSTLFTGLSMERSECVCARDKWLRALLIIHGVFFVSCLIMPMLGIFSAGMEGGTLIGTVVLEFWCAYFLPIGILSLVRFIKMPK